MKEIRIGIFGALRGGDYFDPFNWQEGVKVTAVCERSQRSLTFIERQKGDAKVFDNFDDFIESGLFDAVVLANYFYQHVPYAIKAMEHGIHVLSECTPAFTMAECVELCRAVERTGCKYVLAENYAYFPCVAEMKRVYESGKIGRVLYCEGEYNHPGTTNDHNDLAPGLNHWRNWMPATYYLTHSLAPIMEVTGNIPKKVNCKSIFAPQMFKGTAMHAPDAAAIMILEMDDGSISRITGCSNWAGHGNSFRICGEKGNISNMPGSDIDVRLHYNIWEVPKGGHDCTVYSTKVSDDESLNSIARWTGHGGGDFWVAYHFVRYLRDEEGPAFDVYRAVAMSAVAIQALRSSQNGGEEFEIPDFSKEEERVKWENDTASPQPDENGNVTLSCCSHPDYTPSEEDIEAAEKFWADHNMLR